MEAMGLDQSHAATRSRHGPVEAHRWVDMGQLYGFQRHVTIPTAGIVRACVAGCGHDRVLSVIDRWETPMVLSLRSGDARPCAPGLGRHDEAVKHPTRVSPDSSDCRDSLQGEDGGEKEEKKEEEGE